MHRILVPIAVLALSAPALRAQEADPLLSGLADEGFEARVGAARTLREKGDEGRLALERFLAPELFAPAPERPAPEGLEERVRELVAQLGAEEFQAREDATKALIDLGAHVLPLLAAHDAGGDAEVAARIARVRAALRPPAEKVEASALRREAAAALAAIASPGSIPVFRRLLADGDARIVDLADAGLRGASPIWPEGRDLTGDALLEAWDVALERAFEPAGEPIDLAGEPAARFGGEELRRAAETAFRIRMFGEAAEALAGMGVDAITMRIRSVFTERVDADLDPPAVVRAYATHEMTLDMPAGGGGMPPSELAGKTIHLPLDGSVATGPDGTPVAEASSPIERGLGALGALPSGTWRPGDSRTVAAADVEDLVPFAAPEQGQRSVDAAGRIDFLGRDEAGRARFHVVCFSAQVSPNANQRFWIAGRVVLDPSGKAVEEYRFVGAMEAEAGATGVAPSMAGTIDLSYRPAE